MIIVGETGSGKTSGLHTFPHFCPADAPICVVEDTNELLLTDDTLGVDAI